MCSANANLADIIGRVPIIIGTILMSAAILWNRRKGHTRWTHFIVNFLIQRSGQRGLDLDAESINSKIETTKGYIEFYQDQNR